MTNYLDVYYSRLNHMGETVGERITNNGIRTFQRWLYESPHTVTALSVERGIYFDGIILRSKDKEYQKIMSLHVSNDIPLRVGDIMNWRQPTGELEKWILLSEEKKTNGTYRSFDILKCNYLIKWINLKGYLRECWAYVLSSTDDKIKGNFRTWHNLITPQPNKYVEIIMPRPVDEYSQVKNTVERGINFIIEDEGWTMVEADFTSVNGIIYMSLTENKVNFEYDDIEADIADTDRLLFPSLNAQYKVGEEIVPNFTEQTLNEWQVVLVPPEETECVRFNDNGHLVAVAPGNVLIKMRLKNYNKDEPRKAVTKEFEIVIDVVDEEYPYYISGPDKLRLDRYDTYMLVDEDGTPIISDASTKIVSMSIQEGEEYGELSQEADENGKPIDNRYILHANKKNKLGKIVLLATYADKQYSKTVNIIPLW